ncbi:CRISPR-associated ring nuclease Csm6 [Chitinilyticum piscinae]|uniref:TIGR02584 family CRISPR-associated protein n=1 Tax=Chitinilyticum piscinae TaxID=2866724 RepID=A0A8J7KC16_9NEIS|nr:CRISPR-associated ring nuclease Csm6 [Chitinilyticum piscinae]MBE9610834.1 TIGR02584 family CRISPR-associated protein [Chitinilyticum piscinae]
MTTQNTQTQPASPAPAGTTNKQKKRTLLCVTGLSPQIVTETLYALAVHEHWYAEEIHILSTQKGKQHADNELLHPDRAMLARFWREYGNGHPLPKIRIEAAAGLDGDLLDITDPDSSATMADAIVTKVRELTKNDDRAIHASIAGGRKSMGFLLGYAMSMYGQVQDRLSHVLVTPTEFESHTDFFYKPLASQILHTRDGKTPTPLNTDDANIVLAELPFVRMRTLLGKSANKLLARPLSFAALVEEMQYGGCEPQLTIDVAGSTLNCRGKTIPLAPKEMALYALIAEYQLQGKSFNLEDITHDWSRLEELYWIAKGRDINNRNDVDAAERQRFANGEFWLSKAGMADDKKGKDNIRVVITDIRDKLHNAFAGQCVALRLIPAQAKRGNCRYTLGGKDAPQIILTGLSLPGRAGSDTTQPVLNQPASLRQHTAASTAE